MAFQLKADESVAKGVRRIARRQLDRALAGLTGPGDSGPEEVVHDARKRLKKIRALVRLAAGGLGRKRADREDARLRDAGRPLSEVRDAGVLVAALDRLVEAGGDGGHPEAVGAAREALLRRRRDVCQRVLQGESALVHVAGMIGEVRRDLKRWEWSEGGWDALGPGLERIYARGHRAFLRASEAPTDEGLHRWRKRVKDLGYALEILQPVRPDALGGPVERAHRLADLLGDDHDLAVLIQALPGLSGEAGVPASAAAIRPLIDRRRAGLQREALALGPVLYGEPPGDFAARVRAYWRAWRAEGAAAQFDPD